MAFFSWTELTQRSLDQLRSDTELMLDVQTKYKAFREAVEGLPPHLQKHFQEETVSAQPQVVSSATKVIRFLRENPSKSIQEIAAATDLKVGNVSYIIYKGYADKFASKTVNGRNKLWQLR